MNLIPVLKANTDSLRSILSSLLDNYAKIFSRITVHTNSPWYNSELGVSKRHLRKLDKIYRKQPTPLNYNNFINMRNQFRKICITLNLLFIKVKLEKQEAT